MTTTHYLLPNNKEKALQNTARKPNKYEASCKQPLNLLVISQVFHLLLYLDFASGRLILNVIESIGAIADMVLLDKLLGVSAALRGHPRDVLYATQVNDQLLVEVILRRRPSIQTFSVRENC